MKFMCKQSKEVYEFTQEHDIKGMLEHPDYSVVEETVEPQPSEPKKYQSRKVSTKE